MKKIVAIIMALAMALCFAGCGDSGASDEGQQEPAAEPNAGVQGIVFTMPDGWEQTEDSEGNYVGYENPDSDFKFGITYFDEEMVKEMSEAEQSEAQTVQEYYEESFSMSDQELKENNAEADTGEVCGTEAKVLKWKNGDKGYVDIGTTWVYDDVCYDLWIANDNAFDDDGKVKEDAAVLSDEEIAMYDSVIASITPGDGTKFQASETSADGVGNVKFEAPEGFNVTSASKQYADFENEDGSITLHCFFTDEDGLKDTMDENGNPFETLKDYYNQNVYEGVEKTSIAGCDGYINAIPDEDGNVYFCSAGFMTDDGVYDITMDADAFDDQGNLKDDAKSLTEDDIATFKKFIESFEMK